MIKRSRRMKTYLSGPSSLQQECRYVDVRYSLEREAHQGLVDPDRVVQAFTTSAEQGERPFA
jgi:hypothetical protein